MESRLNGLVISKTTGAVNGVLRAINCDIPETETSIVVEHPSIAPDVKIKVGDCLIGSNGCVGKITDVELYQNDLYSITVIGLGYDTMGPVLPDVTTEDNDKALVVNNGEWNKSYIRKTKDITVDGSITTNGIFTFEDRDYDNPNSGKTNRSIYMKPWFVPYTAKDISLSLRFSDDDNRDIRLMGVKLPKHDTDVANKAYVDHESTKYVSVTHSELMTLRNNGDLIPGCQYRITDYVCTVSNDSEARAISHPYDIIVTADSSNTLNENARACAHNGDNYYTTQEANVNLSAWELKYCIDNDTNRFAWADTANGKGVVFWLKDDWENECPYDFKQIQFKRYKITECEPCNSLVDFYAAVHHNSNVVCDSNDFIWCYTFSACIDGEGTIVDTSVMQNSLMNSEGIIENTYGNKISCSVFEDSNHEKHVFYLSNNVFLCSSYDIFLEDFYAPVKNSLGSGCISNTFGTSFSNNTLNNSCSYNIFRDYCGANSLTRCSYNVFGSNCNLNIFMNNCNNNILNDNFNKNTFGNSCENNIFGEASYGNLVENDCSYLLFGGRCSNNTFKSGCNNIEFRTSASNGNLASGFSNNIINNGNSYIVLWSEPGFAFFVKNYILLQGIVGTENNKEVIELTRNLSYCTFVGQYE